MSSILTTKTLGIIGGIAGVSAIGGSIAYGSGLFNDSKTERIVNNKTNLQDAGFEVLSAEGNNQEWKKVLEAYLLATTGTFKTDGTADKDRTDKQLRDECQRQLTLNTDTSYKLTIRWCVKQEKMSAILGRKSKLLITDSNIDTDNNTWKIKISGLTESEKKSLSIEINNVDATNISSIKEKCKLATDKNTTDAEFNEKFEVVKKVCTVPKS